MRAGARTIMLALCLARVPALAADGHGTGVVTMEPVTVAGNDFCQAFIAAWRDLDGADLFTLAIRERPSARWGTQVWVEFGRHRIYQLRLPATRAAIPALGQEAARAAFQAVLQADLERQLDNDADLAPDEM